MQDFTRSSVRCIRDPSQARLLYDPMRREILRLLAKGEMNQTQLSKELALRTPTIGHHLSLLKANGFVRVVREETGKHGILEKYYESSAQMYFIDGKTMPEDIRRYYMPLVIERARGVLACARISKKQLTTPSKIMERFATSWADNIASLACSYESEPVRDLDPEIFVGQIYAEALENAVQKEFSELRPLILPG